jgi:hypothetical protein
MKAIRTLAAAAAVAVGTVAGYAATNPAGAALRPHAARIVGTWSNDASGGGAGGYRVWSNGQIDPLAGAPYYGAIKDPANTVVGFIGDRGSDGYWIITSNGHFYARGTTCEYDTMIPPKNRPHSGVVGAINLPNYDEGFYMVTSSGRLYRFACGYTF